MGSPGAADAPRSAWWALLGWKGWLGVWVPIGLISAIHFGTPAAEEWVHDIARRLYYLPILLAAFLAGIRGGLPAALLASVVYVPHAFTHLHHMDPGSTLEKILEMVLYLVVGVVAGLLVDRERAERRRQQTLAVELQHTLDDLQETEQQLIRSARLGALGQLTAGLAHEIKNPLHAMRGTAEIVRDALDDDADGRRMQDMHLQEIDRLAGVLERFLNFARPTPPVLTDVELGGVLERVAELIGAQARKSRVHIEVHDGEATVRGDEEQLVQLCLGIALNGLEAVAAVDGERRVDFALGDLRRGQRTYATITIGNNGPTIPEELLERIFDPFVTGSEEGTGLGLSIAARIADAHDGFLEAHNRGDGVVFVVALPDA